MDLKTYLQQAFQLAEPHDLWAAGLGRRLSKWFFEFAQNVMILGVIKYIADITASPILDAFYWAALGMMVVYIYTFTNMVLAVRPFVFLGDNMVSRILNHTFNFGLGVMLFLLAFGAIHVAINEIAKSQVH
jgi:hypothetical protein